jgi:hypothetical protein
MVLRPNKPRKMAFPTAWEASNQKLLSWTKRKVVIVRG